MPEQLRSKLDDRAKKLVFVGYSEQIKGYKAFDPSSHRVTFSKSAVFDEYAVVCSNLDHVPNTKY